MDKTQFTKQLDLLPKDRNQEKLRIAYAKCAVDLLKLYRDKEISVDELDTLTQDLLSRNPDKKDKMLADVDWTIEDVALDPTYYIDESYENIQELYTKIQAGIRYAQAPGLICYYIYTKDEKTLEGIAVLCYFDGESMHVRPVDNVVAKKLTTLLNHKMIGIDQAKKLLPNSIGKYILSRAEKTIVQHKI